MKKRIVFTIVAVAIFCAGYFGIFEKKKDGYDNYAFKGDPVYSSKGYYADYGYDGSYDTGYDYTDTGVTYHK